MLEQLEGRVPEVQAEDLAFARQEIVFDVEAVHGLQVATQDRSRDQFRDLGHFVAALFDGVQRVLARLQALLVALVPLRDARVEVPAVVIEARRGGDERGNVLLRFLLQLNEADHDIGDLNAGVVNVVLDIDGVTGGTQQAHEGVAKDRRCADGRCARPCWD